MFPIIYFLYSIMFDSKYKIRARIWLLGLLSMIEIRQVLRCNGVVSSFQDRGTTGYRALQQ